MFHVSFHQKTPKKTSSSRSPGKLTSTSKGKKVSLTHDNIELQILASNQDKPKDIVVTCSSHCDSSPKINIQGKKVIFS